MVGIIIKTTSQTLMIYVLRNTIFYWHGNNQPTRRPTWPESFDNRWHINEWLYLSPLVLLLCTERPLVCILLCIQSSARKNGFLYKLNLARKTKEKRFYGLSLALKISFMAYIRKCKDKCVRYAILHLKISPYTPNKNLESINYCYWEGW